MRRAHQNQGSSGAKQPPSAATTHTPEEKSELNARRADHIREQALRDPAMLALLDQAHRLREGHEGEWLTFDDLDKQYPAEA
jgi:hypothetical protein